MLSFTPADNLRQVRGVSVLQLFGISILCTTLGFLGSHTATQLMSASAARNAIMGATVASVITSAAIPTYAMEQLATPLTPPTVTMAKGATRYATLAEAPALSSADEQLDFLQLGVMALFVPILGYASWTFGANKAASDRKELQEKFAKDLEEGKLLKVSGSGIATVKGFPMASDPGWKIQAEELRARGIQGVQGAELMELTKTGVTVVDVRAKDRFEKASIPGSINIPLFQPITGWTPYKVARRFQFVIFGVSGTEYNADFMKDFEEKVGGITTDLVFVDDSVRGTLAPTAAFPDGKPGHGLMAIYLTSTAGFKNPMKYLEGGIASFGSAGGELVGSSSS